MGPGFMETKRRCRRRLLHISPPPAVAVGMLSRSILHRTYRLLHTAHHKARPHLRITRTLRHPTHPPQAPLLPSPTSTSPPTPRGTPHPTSPHLLLQHTRLLSGCQTRCTLVDMAGSLHPREAGTGNRNHTRPAGTPHRRDLPLDSLHLEGSLPLDRSFRERIRIRMFLTIFASIIFMISSSRLPRSLGVGRRIRVGGRKLSCWDVGWITNVET